MGNILGEGFSNEIISQINIRQNKLGLMDNISDNILSWYNGKTAWVKLASSININGSDEVAKNNILFGGSTSIKDGSNSIKTGFIENNNSSTYQLGNFGYRPMPFIRDINVDYLNRGSLRKAEINIKAHSAEQLETLSKLYMSVGYTLLLEWGHTSYLDNNGNIQQFNSFFTQPFDKLFNPTTKQQDILDSIEAEKKKYFGNYDALYGKVSNFNWNFNTDGTYDITLHIIALGDIIESLKMNTFYIINTSTSPDSSNTDEEDKTSIEGLKDVSKIHTFFYNITRNIDQKLSGNYSFIRKFLTNEAKQWNMNEFHIKKREFKGATKMWLFKDDNSQYYIKLGTFLNYIQNNVNLFITKDDINSPAPYVTYDTGSDNYCLTFPFHIPADPTVCTIPFRRPSSFEKDPSGGVTMISNVESSFHIDNNPYLGNVMEIEISIEFLGRKLYELKDKQGKVSLLDFLTDLMDDINLNLGGVNQLVPYYDSNQNTIRIIENSPLRYGGLKKTSTYGSFNIYGVSPNLGSFITNVGFNVTISNKFSTMITVGAQANANKVGENATGISTFYSQSGITDRISPEKSTNPTPERRNIFEQNIGIQKNTNFNKKEVKKETSPDLTFGYILLKMAKGLIYIYEDRLLTPETIEIVKSINNDYAKYQIGYLTELKQIPSSFFLPFEMSLTMDGLGGMKIYEKFKILAPSDQILPELYREINGKSKVDFLIKNLTHKVSNNRWNTELKAYAVPSEPSDQITENQSVVITKTEPAVVTNDENDPAVIYNGDNKVGASFPGSSPVAKSLFSKGRSNGQLDINTDLILIGLNNYKLAPSAAESFKKMYKDAKVAGFNLDITSAYRSYAEQKRLAGLIPGRAAQPGSSAHGWGIAVDIGTLFRLVNGSTNPQRSLDARKSSELYKWLAKNGSKYGWYNPWRLSDTAGTDEIWHWEYWGSI